MLAPLIRRNVLAAGAATVNDPLLYYRLVNQPTGLRIQVGKRYPLRLPNGLMGFPDCLIGYLNPGGTDNISLERDSGRELYQAQNLKGVYLQ